MNQPLITSRTGRALVLLAALVVIIAGMRAAEAILVPFILALFIAAITAPLLFWLQRKGLPSALSLLIVVLGVVGTGIVLATLVGTSVSDFSSAMPSYQQRLQEASSGAIQWLSETGIKLPEQEIRESLDPASVMQFAMSLFSSFQSALANSFLILLTTLFMLAEASSLPAKLRSILTDPESSLARMSELVEKLKQYVVLKSLTSLLTAILVSLWLLMLGVDYPLLWGLLAFMLNYVPTIGSIIAAVPAILLAFVQGGGQLALLTMLGYVVVNVVIGSVVEPKLMGKGLGLSTLVVFLSLVFWGWVLGPVGMLLSVPLTMMVKVALEGSEETGWIAILLGSEHEVRT